MSTIVEKKVAGFSDFYADYLTRHSNRTCRELHFLGSTLALLSLAALLLTSNLWWLLAAVASGYGFAWIGHFMFEKKRSAIFKHPLYSFMASWVMYWQMLTGQTSF